METQFVSVLVRECPGQRVQPQVFYYFEDALSEMKKLFEHLKQCAVKADYLQDASLNYYVGEDSEEAIAELLYVDGTQDKLYIYTVEVR